MMLLKKSLEYCSSKNMSIEIRKLGTFDLDIVEINPVVFKGKL